jgi:hypothetical protein
MINLEFYFSWPQAFKFQSAHQIWYGYLETQMKHINIKYRVIFYLRDQAIIKPLFSYHLLH